MPRFVTADDLRLLSKVSKLYYESGLTQDEIVEKLHLSRSKISRLLRQARDEGIVKITVNSPPGVFPELEMQLEKRYGLKDAIIVEVRDSQSQYIASHEIGIAAANYLQRVIHAKDIIGISWGSTLSMMVDAVQPERFDGIQVVQIIGGIGRPESEIHATDLCRRLARLLDCKLTLLPAPGIVDNQQIKEVLRSDSHIQAAMDLFGELTVALVGIGSPAPDSVLMHDSAIITQSELDSVLQRGAVGDIALRFFDECGRPVPSDVDDRVVGITLAELKRVERVIGVAGGPQKIAPIRGALLGGLVNILITDNQTARQLLQVEDQLAPPVR